MTNSEIKTDQGLLDKLKACAKHDLTVEERMLQRVSLVMSVIDDDSGITREKVERDLATV